MMKYFLNFLKQSSRFFTIQIFSFRDFQYGIRSFLEKKDIFITYKESENLANDIAEHFTGKGIFQRVNNQGWKVNYPEFAAVEAGDPFKKIILQQSYKGIIMSEVIKENEINVTEKAVKEIKRIMRENKVPEGYGLKNRSERWRLFRYALTHLALMKKPMRVML